MSKRDNILIASRKAFIEKGYHQTTMQDIADKLNIKRTTLYDYFGSKEAIVFSLIETMYESFPLKRTQGTTMDRLSNLCHQMLIRTIENIDIYRLLFIALPILDDSTKYKIHEWQVPYVVELEEILTKSSFDSEYQEDIKRLFNSLVSQTMSEYITKQKGFKMNEDCQYIMKIVKRVVEHEEILL